MAPMKLLIFGFGYTAQVLCAMINHQAAKIIATSRQAPVASQPDVTVVDFSQAAILGYLPTVTHILVSVPPTAIGDPVLLQFAEVLTLHARNVRWIGYLSSTGVYGDHSGRWVDEQSSCVEPGYSGQKRLMAERAWQAFASQSACPLTIFRVAGIYGPGRNPLVRLLAGQSMSIDKPNQVFSRIHVVDLAASIARAMEYPERSGIYNVADDEPAPSHEVNAFAANLLGLPVPHLIPYDSADISPELRAFYQANRRVSNAKLKRDLGFQFLFPSYREGLIQLLATMT